MSLKRTDNNNWNLCSWLKFCIWIGSLVLCAIIAWTAATEGMDIRKGGSLWARIEPDGYIRIEGSLEGRFESDGVVRKDGSLIGKIENDGTIRRNGSIWGSVSDCCNDFDAKRAVATVLVFFTKDFL